MASDVLNKDGGRFGHDPVAPAPSVQETLRKVLAPLASLKLTVALMALGILLVLFGTLAQQYMNEFEAMKRFFRTWFTFVEIRSFFPKNFFPNLFFDKQPQIEPHWGFFFPGGFTIGGLMALNLLAAHALRFKAQASGVRLWSGLAVIAIGVLVTYFVIVAGPDKDGFEASTKVHWADIHWYVKAALLGLIGACVAPLFKWQERGHWERIGLVTAAVLLSGLTGYLLYRGDEPVVQPEGLRILWQLLKGTLAGVVLLVGCILVFRKRAGVTLLHAGVLLMMSNELIVYNWHAENLLHANVGETVNYVTRIRSPELAIIDTSNPKVDEVTAIPASLLEKGNTLDDKSLPFDIELVEWLQNSLPKQLPPHMPNTATAGHGLRMTVESQPPASGASGDKEDMPAAFIRLKSKPDGKDLGTYLVSYWFDPRLSEVDETLSLDEGQSLEVGGKTYQISLRPRRTYKPYSLHLVDARESKYVGTNTAKSYESDAKLIDQNGVSRDVHIWMNNPVRYGGETFYQSSYGEDPKTGVKFSIFQVVANVGWMVPYVACMIVAVGMLAHFSLTLVRFLRRMDKEDLRDLFTVWHGGVFGIAILLLQGTRQQHKGSSANDDSTEANDPLLRAVNIVIPLAAVLIPAIMLVSMNRTPQQIDTAFHYWDCADLPVAYEGRVKPWDSLARNSLRVISNKETFKDNSDNKQPAIRWLLDVVARPDDADKYAVFRIEHAAVLNIFGLDQKEGLRYSIDDLRPHMDDFEDQVAKLEELPPDTQGEFERKVLELDQHLKLYLTLRASFRTPPRDDASALEKAAYIVDVTGLRTKPYIPTAPRAVPVPSTEHPWEVATFTNAQLWLRRLAEANGDKTADALSQRLIEDVRKTDTEALVRSRTMLYVEGVVRQKMPDAPEKELRKIAAERLAELPADMRSMIDRQIREELDQSMKTMQASLALGVRKLLGESALDAAPNRSAVAVCDLLTAYRDGSVSKFNQAIAAEKESLAAAPPVEYRPDKDEFERYFNYLAPFSTARWLYLIAFVMVAIGWLGWLKPFNRAAFSLILFTFLIHTFAIVGRIYISGRPPVTNLYSSAVFIGWGGVLLGIILEILYGLSYGNVIAAVIGHLTLAIADHLSLEGETFIVMQAVLDTQFWLATHVSCVTLGYTTTYVAGLLGLVYLLAGMFTPSLTDKHGKLIARMIYGTTCFSIFFSFVGTVLGGLWADDSWGRFWGWDPKENGALIIVLWNALVLHARWDGLVKDRGLAVLALVGNIVTSWSWFGVNQLGLGRHSYGFTREVVDGLAYLVLSHLVLIALGSFKQSWWWSVRAQKAAAMAGNEKRRGKRASS